MKESQMEVSGKQQMMRQEQAIPFSTLGKFSQSLLVSSTQAVVTGVIAKMVFCRFITTEWIPFLSFESYRAPLTLNLSGAETALKSVEVHDRIVIQGEKFSSQERDRG